MARRCCIDFGFARHAHYPDLLAEGDAFAAGSAAYVSPEQLQGIRTDPRSDVFALGAILYELATGEPPFGEPETFSGLRDRLWRIPAPPRSIVPELPPWLQEVILHCLERRAERRYASAAHVAFDLRHPEQVPITVRGRRASAPGFLLQLGRWWRLKRATPAPRVTGTQAPVILVAVDTEHVDDERHTALQQATRTLIAANADYRLMLVSAIGAAPLGEGDRLEDTASGKHLEHRNRLRQWVAPLRLAPARTSLHVVESGDAAQTILDMARVNHVDLIVIGAPGPGSRPFAWLALDGLRGDSAGALHRARRARSRAPVGGGGLATRNAEEFACPLHDRAYCVLVELLAECLRIVGKQLRQVRARRTTLETQREDECAHPERIDDRVVHERLRDAEARELVVRRRDRRRRG